MVSAKDGLSVISRPPSCGEALGSEEEDSDSVVVVSFWVSVYSTEQYLPQQWELQILQKWRRPVTQQRMPPILWCYNSTLDCYYQSLVVVAIRNRNGTCVQHIHISRTAWLWCQVSSGILKLLNIKRYGRLSAGRTCIIIKIIFVFACSIIKESIADSLVLLVTGLVSRPHFLAGVRARNAVWKLD